MMAQPILPQLKRGNQVANFGATGEWDNRQWGQAKNLYEGLELEKIDFQVNSIPDAWARPVLFEMILFDPGKKPEPGVAGPEQKGHPLHERVLGEWRGLLALFALRTWRGITDLAVDPVFVGDPANWPDFLKVTANLAPRKTLAPDTLWTSTCVILLGGQPIGLFSPTTLVCTATDCTGRIRQEQVPWFDDKRGRLQDPKGHLGADEKRGLAAWLNRLKDMLTHHAGLLSGSNEWLQLSQLLADFATDLLQSQPPLQAGECPNHPNGLTLRTGVFRYLSCALKEVENRKSHVRLIPSEGRGEGAPDWLMLDKNIAGDWGLGPNEVVVWSGVPLSAALSPASLQGPRNRVAGRAMTNAEWAPAPEIFSDCLYLIRQKNALPGAMQCDGADRLLGRDNLPVTPLLPLKERLLTYLSPKEIKERMSFEPGPGSDEVTVRFRLPLTGTSLAGEEFVVSKTYSYPKEKDPARGKANGGANDPIVTLGESPVIEIWPNFQIPGWKAYYCYYSTGSVAGSQQFFRAKPLGGSGESRSVENFEITRLEKFPEAMVCSGPGGQYAGVILLNRPGDDPAPQGRTYKIGVDFGTTGTRIFTREGETEPQQVVFAPRMMRVTDSSVQNPEYKEFLPSLAEKTESLLSLFHEFAGAPQAPRPILDGHVYFVRDYTQFNASRQDIAKNMKWGQQERERVLARLFLHQLCLQTSAEAVNVGVGAINWRFSFPASFSTDDRQAFGQVWRSIMTGCAADTGLTHTLGPRKDESIAAARFFARRMGAPLDRGTVCLDIGGGTSDIAVWQDENTLRCHASVRLAGRDIFLYPLYVAPRFLETCFSMETNALNEAASNRLEDAFYAQADALLKSKGDQMLMSLSQKAAEPKVKEFLRLIEVGLSGLFYYVGLTLKALTEQGQYREQMPNVYLGGNGAKLMLWCNMGEFDPESRVIAHLKKMLAASTGFAQTPFDIAISVQPKAEVAYGLLIDEQFVGTAPRPPDGGDTDADEGEEPDSRVVAGETFTQKGKNHQWGEWLDVDTVHEGVRVDPELKNFAAFVAALPRVEGEPAALDEAVRQRIVADINNELINDSKQPRSKVRLQPLFIAALKSYLRAQADGWAKGQAAAGGSKA
jgi:hypothetical protein